MGGLEPDRSRAGCAPVPDHLRHARGGLDHLTGIKLLAPHLTAENHRSGAGVRPLEEQAGDRRDRRPAAPAAGRAHVGLPDPGVRGRAPAAADGSSDALRRRRRRRRDSSRATGGPIGTAGAACRPDATLPEAIQAPAHHQRGDPREAAAREGPARAHGSGRRRRRRAQPRAHGPHREARPREIRPDGQAATRAATESHEHDGHPRP